MHVRVKAIARTAEPKRRNSDFKKRTSDLSGSKNSPFAHIKFLQKHMGNQAVQRLFESNTIQAKIRIGRPGDKYEQEADRVANQVMNMPEPQMQCQVVPEEEEEPLQAKPIAEQITPLVQRQVEEDEEEEEEPVQSKIKVETQVQRQEEEPEEEEVEHVQTKRVGGRSPQSGPKFEAQISSIKTGGQPLPQSIRIFFESRFGKDFSQVRIHKDTKAAELSQNLNARAFTVGQNVVFGAGQYAPHTRSGQKLLSHELTHVLQQMHFDSQFRGKSIFRGSIGISRVDVKPMGSLRSPFIQRQGRKASQICSGLTVQVTVPGIIPSTAGGAKILKLGPFSCKLGKCQISHGSQVIPITDVRKYYKHLLKAVNFSKKLIKKISGYLKRVSATAKYSAFIRWLQKLAGVKPSKPGVTPSAAVAAETIAFISPTSILNEWSKLGKIKPPTGTDPFDNWVSMLHEQHHRKTILSHPSIVQAFQQISKAKAALLSNQSMMAPFDNNLRSKADKETPKQISDEQIAIQAMRKKTYQDINSASAGRLRALGLRRLLTLKYIPNRKRVIVLVNKYKKLGKLYNAYYTQEISLKRSLQQHYGKYEQWFENARNFALEDLKAYCVSWKAEKKALEFIKRCCRAALRGKSGRRRR